MSGNLATDAVDQPWAIISYYPLMGCITLLHYYTPTVQYNEILYMIMDPVNTRSRRKLSLRTKCSHPITVALKTKLLYSA